MEDKKLDVTTYPECLEEIIPYLDFLPEDREIRIAYIETFVARLSKA